MEQYKDNWYVDLPIHSVIMIYTSNRGEGNKPSNLENRVYKGGAENGIGSGLSRR